MALEGCGTRPRDTCCPGLAQRCSESERRPGWRRLRPWEAKSRPAALLAPSLLPRPGVPAARGKGRLAWAQWPELPQHPPRASPVAVDEAGVDVVGALDAPDGLQADSRQLVRHDVHEAVLELVAGEVGTDET